MNEHFSKRLGRNYVDDDLLTREEAAEVLSTNACRDISSKYVTDMVAVGIIRSAKKQSPRKLLYQYSDLRHYVVASRPGRRAHDNPSPTAVRQRVFKARRKEEQLAKVREAAGVHEIKEEPGE